MAPSDATVHYHNALILWPLRSGVRTGQTQVAMRVLKPAAMMCATVWPLLCAGTSFEHSLNNEKAGITTKVAVAA